MSAPPGWHRQTDGRERFWDGEAWTEDFRGGSVLPVEAPPENGGSGGGFFKSWMGYLGAGLLGLLVGIMIGSSGGSDGSADPVAAPLMSTPVVTQTVQATVTATTTASVPPTSVAPTTPAPAKSTSAAAETFKMPQLVGENLQLAQDKLQKLGSYVMDQQDALGLDRVQVLDSNWQVCSQKPAPGKTVAADTVITLAAVKLSENCP